MGRSDSPAFPRGSDPEQITLPLKLFSCVGTRGSVHCSGRRSGRRHYRKQIQQLPSKELFSPQGLQAAKLIDRQEEEEHSGEMATSPAEGDCLWQTGSDVPFPSKTTVEKHPMHC